MAEAHAGDNPVPNPSPGRAFAAIMGCLLLIGGGLLAVFTYFYAEFAFSRYPCFFADVCRATTGQRVAAGGFVLAGAVVATAALIASIAGFANAVDQGDAARRRFALWGKIAGAGVMAAVGWIILLTLLSWLLGIEFTADTGPRSSSD